MQKKQLREQQRIPLVSANDDMTDFNEQFIKPKMEPDGASSGSVYSLEAKDTHATAVETFSSGEENTAYSEENDRDVNFSDHDRSRFEDGAEFIDLSYEASRQEKFVNLVQDPPATTGSYEQEHDDTAPENFAQPETIEFVDSEDGKVFNITQESTNKETIGHGGFLQNVRSLDDSNTLGIDECSKTLNTNNETLQSLPSLNDDDVANMRYSHGVDNLHVNVGDEGETFEERDPEVTTAYENGNYDEDAQEESQLYDCDDGEMYYAQDGQQREMYSTEDVQVHGYEEDGNFFEQLRDVQSRHHVSEYQSYPGPMEGDEEIQPEHWRSVTQQMQYENAQISHLNRPVSPHLEDPYLSDANSSWEEGSFGTGASRTKSRVDDDDDAESYDGSDYSSDDGAYTRRQSDRPIVKLLKKFRDDLNVNDEQSRGESSDEEEKIDRDDRKMRSRRKQKRRIKKTGSDKFFESIREIGTDILEETIDFAESKDRPGSMIMDSFADLFSCGAQSEY
jgi:hypothetical protein